MFRKLSALSIAVILMSLVLTLPASANVLQRISFDGYANDTPETALGIPGVTFQANGWKTRLLTSTIGDGSIVNGYVLRNRITGSFSTLTTRTLVIDFEDALRYYKFGYALFGDYDPVVNGYLNGQLVFSRTYDAQLIVGPDVYGGFIEGNDVDFNRLEVIFQTFQQDVVIDDIVTDTSFADGRLNANPALDWAPAHVDYCQNDLLIVRLPDGHEAIVLPLSEFSAPPASGFKQIAFNLGIYVDQAASGAVYITGFQYDPYWPNNGKPYVIRIDPDCSNAMNVSPFTPADYNP